MKFKATDEQCEPLIDRYEDWLEHINYQLIDKKLKPMMKKGLKPGNLVMWDESISKKCLT